MKMNRSGKQKAWTKIGIGAVLLGVSAAMATHRTLGWVAFAVVPLIGGLIPLIWGIHEVCNEPLPENPGSVLEGKNRRPEVNVKVHGGLPRKPPNRPNTT